MKLMSDRSMSPSASRRVVVLTRRAALVLLMAGAIYLAAVAVFLILLFASGDGVSCDSSCGPVARFADAIAPWGAIGCAVAALVLAGMAVQRRTRSS